jgi:hypothetical protein
MAQEIMAAAVRRAILLLIMAWFMLRLGGVH